MRHCRVRYSFHRTSLILLLGWHPSPYCVRTRAKETARGMRRLIVIR